MTTKMTTIQPNSASRTAASGEATGSMPVNHGTEPNRHRV